MTDSCAIASNHFSGGPLFPNSLDKQTQILKISTSLFSGLLHKKVMLGAQSSISRNVVEDITKNIYAIGTESCATTVSTDASSLACGNLANDGSAVPPAAIRGAELSASHRTEKRGLVSNGTHNRAHAYVGDEVPSQAVQHQEDKFTQGDLSKKSSSATMKFEASSPAVSVSAAPGRSCAHCRTQKTPLWRNGPFGPKTLCNACGVRFKLGKLTVNANGTSLVPSQTAVARKRQQAQVGSVKDAAKRPRPSPKPAFRRASSSSCSSSSDDEKPKTQPEPFLTTLSEHDGALLLMRLAGVFS